MTQEIYDKWKRWMIIPMEDSDLARELDQLANETDAKRESKILDRFYKDLEFGTGGLRGILGVGTNRMNVYTVARATQGYVEYLNEFGRERIAIAYDSRIKSELFARIAAEVLVAGGIQVYLFRELMPTPILSYAIRYLQCDGGIVITASHNPAEYNGYKVYGSDGGQITNAAAEAILKKIQKIDLFSNVRRVAFDQGIEQGRIFYVSKEVTEAYLKSVSKEGLGDGRSKDLSIVYTPLNGTGRCWVLRALQMSGFQNLKLVEEQSEPDGNFPTCRIPNPEKKEALQLGIDYAAALHADLVLATDPDCDRVGIAVRDENDYKILSGNEIGLLLLDYICQRRIAEGIMPKKPLCMKTIVTTDLAYKVGESYGVEVRDVLTGFKYIGEEIGKLDQRGEKERFILGIEESYGYLSGTYVRDKDGVNASLLICEMTAFYKMQGMTLVAALECIYHKFGYCLNKQYTYTFEGILGESKMLDIMKAIRSSVKESDIFLGKKLFKVSDYLQGLTSFISGKTEYILLPKSNVCKIYWEDGNSLVVRPSGTEPKLKIYLTVSGKSRVEAETSEKIISALIADYIKKIAEQE